MFFAETCVYGSDPSVTYYSPVVILSPAANYASKCTRLEIQFVSPTI